VHAWIDRDNINQLISNAGFSGDIGLLSVDIDGNDYWVWQAIDAVNPVIVAVEWNSVFGPEAAISIPYDPKFFAPMLITVTFIMARPFRPLSILESKRVTH